MTTPQRIVIVGGGQAGGWAAKTLRDRGYTGELVLVGEETHPPYERPPLSKAVLAGEAQPESVHLFKDALFDALDINWRRGRRAADLDRGARRVRLDDGSEEAYDRMLLCMGGRARPLPLEVPGDVDVAMLRTIDDALALRNQLRTRPRLLVIGGGWIGLEVAATARKMGSDVHVVEALQRLCARVLPVCVSSQLLALHASHGVTFSLGVTVERLERSGATVVRAHLSDGTAVEADRVFAGLGMMANDGLAREAGIECRNGIVVDASCATSDPIVFAAGDVAVAPNRWAAGLVRLESWQNAQDQGIAAARAMLGEAVAYDPVPRFWSDQYDVNLQIEGLPPADCQSVNRGDIGGGRYITFAHSGGCVHAAIGYNAGREMRTARKVVASRAAIDPSLLADPAADLGVS
jgi:3-phenylpropionate/trans-cinnamate dioxygenase ferredoxin reductase subunit